MKKIIVCMTAILLTLNLFVPTALATSSTEIMPRWDNVQMVATQFVFYENIGEATATVTKGSGCTSLNGVITIYEFIDNEWVYLDSITKSTTRASLGMIYEFEGESGMEYKMEFVVTAYNGTTVIEEITDTKYAACH